MIVLPVAPTNESTTERSLIETAIAQLEANNPVVIKQCLMKLSGSFELGVDKSSSSILPTLARAGCSSRGYDRRTSNARHPSPTNVIELLGYLDC
jgi:hypothetical protein